MASLWCMTSPTRYSWAHLPLLCFLSLRSLTLASFYSSHPLPDVAWKGDWTRPHFTKRETAETDPQRPCRRVLTEPGLAPPRQTCHLILDHLGTCVLRELSQLLGCCAGPMASRVKILEKPMASFRQGSEGPALWAQCGQRSGSPVPVVAAGGVCLWQQYVN